MTIPKISITEFNQNISKFIKRALKGEVLYLTSYSKIVVVLISKKNFDVIMSVFLKQYEGNKKKGKS